jgi:oxygen-independent coproporphyrinogen-3 oxidase
LLFQSLYRQRFAAIRGYIDAALKELALYAAEPFVGGRKANFVYFGGGTPSYLSVDQLKHLTDGMKRVLPWDEVEEVTFECEPGTLTDHKLKAIREMGVTRLSLGVENFDDHILEINGRAHRSKEIWRAYGYARELRFPQINIDLIAGMVEETEANWRECVSKTIELSPDSVTIYQMEVPYNTGIYRQMKAEGKLVAPWRTGRPNGLGSIMPFVSWRRLATPWAALTMVKSKEKTRFLYRDKLWAGADLLALGVASFGHLNGVHYQNHHDFAPYIERVRRGGFPIHRALTPSADERFIREFILQLKLGTVSAGYFTNKFGTTRACNRRTAGSIEGMGISFNGGDRITITREALQVDRLCTNFSNPNIEVHAMLEAQSWEMRPSNEALLDDSDSARL